MDAHSLANYCYNDMSNKTKMSHTVTSVWLRIALVAICESEHVEDIDLVETKLIKACQEYARENRI